MPWTKCNEWWITATTKIMSESVFLNVETFVIAAWPLQRATFEEDGLRKREWTWLIQQTWDLKGDYGKSRKKRLDILNAFLASGEQTFPLYAGLSLALSVLDLFLVKKTFPEFTRVLDWIWINPDLEQDFKRHVQIRISSWLDFKILFLDFDQNTKIKIDFYFQKS